MDKAFSDPITAMSDHLNSIRRQQTRAVDRMAAKMLANPDGPGLLVTTRFDTEPNEGNTFRATTEITFDESVPWGHIYYKH